MNATLNISFISDVPETAEMVTTFQQLFLRVLFVILVFLQLIFPFYVYVNRVNRERDKNTLVFPMLNHFYTMMKITQAIYCFITVTLLYDVNYGRTGDNPLSVFCVWAFSFWFCIIFFYIQVFQFFLTIMAIQKFLLYFYPSSQKYIILSSKNMKYFIRSVYCLFISSDVISFCLCFFSSSLHRKLDRRVVLIFFYSMNVFYLASALLYIPILISIRKVSHLRSVQESKPQIYIFWQTMTALVVKMIYAPYVSFVFDDIAEMIFITRVFDLLSVPVIIQVSYLTCKRQNVITLFASFKGMQLIKELIKPEVTTRVSPDPRRRRI